MKYSQDDILELSEKVKLRLSEKRFKHTLSVLDAAKRIGSFFSEIDLSELSCAALLHDVTKELSYDEQIALFDESESELSEEDRETSAIVHSLSAPIVVKRDFIKFATPNILSAVENHTTGCAGMSIFEKIIFIADYVEDTRTYETCIAVRKDLYDALSDKKTLRQNEDALDRAVYMSLDFTEKSILKQGRVPNSRSYEAKKDIADRLNLNLI